ncbi:hypothetical protein V5F59_01960 [Xanthobacter autotrophicus DSM 431]|uniref:hypothetical protein n=1 Tax=Xanthobacter nonsaccharivorans TaxID=3119912 RepID=UPI003727EB2A
MRKRTFILLAGATLVAASAFGDTLVNALPAASVTPSLAATDAADTPYQWHGYFGPRLVMTDAYVPACPLRKVWTETDGGPRLKWRRACPEQN